MPFAKAAKHIAVLATGANGVSIALVDAAEVRIEAGLNLGGDNSDIVIFDSPPLHAVTDAAILSSFLDGTLLVIDARHSRQKSVRLGRAALARAGARMLGAVLNRSAAASKADFADYYGSEAGPDRSVGGAGEASGGLHT